VGGAGCDRVYGSHYAEGRAAEGGPVIGGLPVGKSSCPPAAPHGLPLLRPPVHTAGGDSKRIIFTIVQEEPPLIFFTQSILHTGLGSATLFGQVLVLAVVCVVCTMCVAAELKPYFDLLPILINQYLKRLPARQRQVVGRALVPIAIGMGGTCTCLTSIPSHRTFFPTLFHPAP
jgi:hypothetical protein